MIASMKNDPKLLPAPENKAEAATATE